MKFHHVIDTQQFSVPSLMEMFERTRQMERVVARGGTLDYQHKIMASLYYQPSTRTRLSFEAAMYRLGGKVFSTEQAGHFSSQIEGERLEDTIRIVSGCSDVIVLRHSEAGGAARAAAVSPVPVINAGENDGQHPTQALLDLYTIYRERRGLDGVSIALIGELDRGRSARSLAYLLSKFERVKIYFVSPRELQMKADILKHLEEHNVWYSLETDVMPVISRVDVVYLTRIRPGRMANVQTRMHYSIDSETLKSMKPGAMIMHPLPRTIELDKTVDEDARAVYFRQATNGLYVRMAILSMVLDMD